MSRSPVPTALKVLRGNPGGRPISEDEPTPPRGAEMPKWLSRDAKKHWKTVVQTLTESGVLTNMDQTALATYCETFARWQIATKEITVHGSIVKSAEGIPRVSPYVRVAEKALDQIVKMLTEFGMTPASRTRVKAVPKAPDEDVDAFDEFND